MRCGCCGAQVRFAGGEQLNQPASNYGRDFGIPDIMRKGNSGLQRKDLFEERIHAMRNSMLYVAAIVLGVLALLVGVFYEANILLGSHPTRGYAAIAVGAVLLIGGVVGIVVGRSRDQA